MIQVFQSPGKAVWVDLTFNAADFTATTGTWTVQAGDVQFLRYMLIGKLCIFRMAISSTVLSNITQELRFALPAALTPAVHDHGTIDYINPTGTSHFVGRVVVDAGIARLRFTRQNEGTDSFQVATEFNIGTTFLFEIQ